MHYDVILILKVRLSLYVVDYTVGWFLGQFGLKMLGKHSRLAELVHLNDHFLWTLPYIFFLIPSRTISDKLQHTILFVDKFANALVMLTFKINIMLSETLWRKYLCLPEIA